MSAFVRHLAGWRSVGPAIWASPTLLLCVASLCWALNPIIGRAVRDLVSPSSLAFWRWAVAFLCVLPFAWRHLKADRQTLRDSWLFLTLLGFFGVGFFSYIVYCGLQYTTATNSLLLQSIMPILTLVMPAVLFGERLRPVLALSAVLSFAGIMWIVTKGHPLDLRGSALNIGDVLSVTGVFLYSVYATFLRKVPALHPLTLLAALFAIGMGSMAVPYAANLASNGPSMPPVEVVAAILYVGVFPSLVAYGLFNRAVVLIGSARSGIYMNLPPVFGVALAVPLLGEKLALYHLVGAVIIIIAIAISRERRAGTVDGANQEV
ncbi:MAG: permease [Hyphomonas sp. BRH_c22]|uniref:DMT family transporter n=1 Tax=Hyphomonadaceae TaxID=69657 RepID=UPI00061EF901|nr:MULTISPECIES: DMT family transporter [Hyphomonadaceae]KJS38879.1 MAG: permease [Hyphomonas sp. BRH_c22]RIJ16639.1 DMT family transporter [Henriciella mobilis]RIJ20120.1 DMT family transporter [Henriciella mobilis]